MKYLVDTDRLIGFLLGNAESVEILERLFPSGLAISLVTYGEIYEGVYASTDSKENERSFRRLLRNVRVLPLNESIMRRFAQIRGDLRRRDLLIGDPDILIAATAIHHDLILVTRNLRHFQRVQHLRIFS